MPLQQWQQQPGSSLYGVWSQQQPMLASLLMQQQQQQQQPCAEAAAAAGRGGGRPLDARPTPLVLPGIPAAKPAAAAVALPPHIKSSMRPTQGGSYAAQHRLEHQQQPSRLPAPPKGSATGGSAVATTGGISKRASHQGFGSSSSSRRSQAAAKKSDRFAEGRTNAAMIAVASRW
jgi:hypothetical protein